MAKNSCFALIKDPIISEKTAKLKEANKYVFYVDTKANKIELAKSFELLFPGRRVVTVKTISCNPVTVRRGKYLGLSKRRKKAVFTIIGDSLEQLGTV